MIYRFTFADAVRQPRQLEPQGLAFDGEGMEVRKYRDDNTVLYQSFCICGAHQLEPGSRSAANRWCKLHRQVCQPPPTQKQTQPIKGRSMSTLLEAPMERTGEQ